MIKGVDRGLTRRALSEMSGVAFPKNRDRKEGHHVEKPRGQMLGEFFSGLKDLVKGLLERLMLEERKLYLEEYPTRGNGYYTRDPPHPLRPHRRPESPPGAGRGLPPQTPPYRRRASLDFMEVVLLLLPLGGEHPSISRFTEAVYGAFYSPQSSFVWCMR